MNNKEYVIISKTALEKRIEELENERYGFVFNPNKTAEAISHNKKIELLKQVLSQSTPLIPELSKAYDAGKLDKELSLSFDNPKSRYLNSLKLKL